VALYGGITLPGEPDLDNIRRLDLMPMRPIREMMRYGMAIDIERLRDISGQLGREMAELRIKICAEIPEEVLDSFIEKSNLDAEDDYLPMNVESTKQMRKLLFETLGVGKGRELKLTATGDISTGKRQLEARKGDHPVVQDVLNYRAAAKLKNTYSEKLPTIAKHHPHKDCWCGLKHDVPTWRVHCDIMTTRTKTGRPATKNPNLQNIPVRSKVGREIRSCFVASPGRELTTVDFSQLELRRLAHKARVKKMIQVFLADQDIHTATAMAAFKESDPSKIDPVVHRAPAKNVNFAIVYGETAKGLYDQLISDTYGKSGIPVPDWLTLEWCEKFMRDWFEIYPEVHDYMKQQHYRARRYGMVWTEFGRIRRIPEVRSEHRRVVAEGDRQAGNMGIQGDGADMLKLAQAEIQDWIEQEIRPLGVWCWPLNEVHDELIFEHDPGWGEIILAKCVDVMNNVLVDKDTGQDMSLVPVKAEGKVMLRWEK
jgi:DNA polymerase-1